LNGRNKGENFNRTVKKRGNDVKKEDPLRPTREDVLWLCEFTPTTWIKNCIENGEFMIVNPGE
jgi:hypothetical protein